MAIKTHETGSILELDEKPQDPLPDNWRSSRWNPSGAPMRFRRVDQERQLFASALVTPNHIDFLGHHNIKDIICFLPNIDHWIDGKEGNLNIHHFPIYRRRHLNEQVLIDVARLVFAENRPMIFHCLKGATRTGMFEQFWQIVIHGRNPIMAALDSTHYGNRNISSFLEMQGYSKRRKELRDRIHA